jgi:maltose/maltodextrin transport system substrate-binding protein/arabinogalactan oligomer/maltooligosaccharide transport system substrate-binding protein
MKRSIFVLVSIMMVGSMLLTACGGATATPVATAVPATKAPATAVPATVVPTPAGQLVIWADDTRAPIIEDLAADVLAAYNVELIVELKANLRDDFQIAAPVGEGPDILFGIPHDQIPTMVANGLIAPIDLGTKADQFAPVAVAACTIDGVLYCMPYATENLGFFYNTALVTTPPTTWDEVVSVGEKLIADGKVTYVMATPGALDYNMYPLYTAFGGFGFGKNASGNWDDQQVGLDSPGMIAGVQFLADLAAKGEIPTDFDWANNHALFETGEAPFIMAGPWALNRIRESGIPYAVADFFPSGPAGVGYPLAGTQGILVNAQSKNVLLAQTFLNEFIATDAVMQKLVDVGQRPSAYLPVLDATSDADLLALGKAGANAEMMPAIPAMGAVWANWGNGVALAVQGKETAEVSMKDAATKTRNVIANPLTGMYNVPGSYQAIAGCTADWLPDCAVTAMAKGDDGLWHSGPFDVVAGKYEAKVALDGTWTTNYGSDGNKDGPNYVFEMVSDGTVEFVFDDATHLLTITVK